MKRFKSIFVFVGYAAFITVLHYYLLKTDLRTGWKLIIEGATACIFFILLGVSDYIGKQNLNVTNLFALGALLRVGIGGVYAGVLIEADFPWLLDVRGYVPVDTAAEGLFLMHIGSILFLMGVSFYKYAELKKRPQQSNTEETPRFPRTWFIWMLVFSGWMVRVFGIRFGVVGQVLMLLPSAGTFLFATAAISGSKKKVQHWACAFFIVIWELWFARHSVMREAYAFVFLPILLALTLKFGFGKKIHIAKTSKSMIARSPKSKIKLMGTSLIGVLLGVFIMIVVFPAASLVKENRFDRIDEALIYVLQNIKENTSDINHFPNHGIYAFGLRMANIVSSSAVIIRLVNEEMQPTYDPIQNIMAGFVPRILWKNKPVISRGGEFAEFLNPDVWDDTSFALTSPGELYWSYGWLGMALGMLAMGFIVNMFWKTSLKKIFHNVFNIIMIIVIAQESIRWFEGSASAVVSLLFAVRIVVFILTKPLQGLFTRRKLSYRKFRYVARGG
ncbi:MAG: hypothetical protein H6757_04015 [Candidatus Omnitrophica bacterium]|nr:hypothetical protein [Candidatus Omnitrophota bacterium]